MTDCSEIKFSAVLSASTLVKLTVLLGPWVFTAPLWPQGGTTRAKKLLMNKHRRSDRADCSLAVVVRLQSHIFTRNTPDLYALSLYFPRPLNAARLPRWRHPEACPEPGSVCSLLWAVVAGFVARCSWFLPPPDSHGELRGSGSGRAGTLVLGAAPAAADGVRRARGCRVRTGEMDPERGQCEFLWQPGFLTSPTRWTNRILPKILCSTYNR